MFFSYVSIVGIHGESVKFLGYLPIAIKELMGHSEIRTTMRYAHLGQHTLRQAIQVLEKPQTLKICHKGVTNHEINVSRFLNQNTF
jgi:hypothetical protein